MKFVIKNKKIFYAGLVYFICILLFICFRILWGTGVFNSLDPIISDLVFGICVQVLTLTLLPFLLYKFLTKQRLKEVANSFFFKKIDLKTVFYSILAGILVYIIIVFVSSFWSMILSLFGYSSSSGSTTSNLPVWLAFLLSIVSTCLLPGWGEEVAHRGMSLSVSRKNGLGRAILFSALLFALAHLNIAQAGYAFVVGLILGSVTLITRSIFPAMIMHATSNFCSVYLSFAEPNGWLFGNAMNSFTELLTSNWVAGLIVSFLLLSVVFTLLMLLFVQFFKSAKTRRFDAFCKKLYQDTRGTPMAEQINFNDKLFMLNLFTQAAAQDLKQKIDKGAIPIEHLNSETNSNPLYTMMDSEFEEYSRPYSLDYLFYYITIFMASVVTLITLIWGVL